MKALVIGGGIIGSSVAWRLAREGAEVTILERGRLGQEASWAAAGMIAPQAEAQGPGPFFDLCVRAREVFVATVPILRDESGIDPEYDDAGILYVAFDAAESTELRDRARWQKTAGGVAFELSAAEAHQLEPALAPEVIYAVHMPADRRVDNRQLTRAFAAAAVAHGAQIHEGVRVDSIVLQGDRASGVRLHDGKQLTADVIVNAAGAWAGDIRGLEADQVSTYPVRGQMLCFEGLKPLAGPSVFSAHGYLVPRRDGRLLAGSTMEEAGYDKEVTLEGIAKIAHGACKMMPSVGNLPFREAWAGLRPATRDFLPILGPSPTAGNVLYATGHFRSGILLAALTGEIIADLAYGRAPSINLAPFAPARLAKAGKVTALGLVRDILFRSRIDAAAQVLGVNVAYASTLEQGLARCAELEPVVVFADLSDANFPAEATAAGVKRGGKVRLVGFASHVDLKALKAARDAGFDQTLSRSEFTSRVAEFLK
jgi:glycine oxidase